MLIVLLIAATLLPTLLIALLVRRHERKQLGRAGPLSWLVTPAALTLAVFLCWRFLGSCGEACGMLWMLTLVALALLGVLAYAAVYVIYTLLLAGTMEKQRPSRQRYVMAAILGLCVISVETALHPFARLLGFDSHIPFTARVVDQDGKPVSGATVAVRYSRATEKNGYTRLTTDADGGFSLKHLRAEEFCLHEITKPGYRFERFRCFEVRNGRLGWKVTDSVEAALPAPVQPLLIHACGTASEGMPPAYKYEITKWDGEDDSADGAQASVDLAPTRSLPPAKLTIIRKSSIGLEGEGRPGTMALWLNYGEVQPASERLMREAPADGYQARWEGTPQGLNLREPVYRFYLRTRDSKGLWHYGRLSVTFVMGRAYLEYWLNAVPGRRELNPLLDTSATPMNDEEDARANANSGSLGGGDC